MSLTGIPLIVVVAVLTVGAVICTVLFWTRAGRWQLLVRAMSVLFCESIALLSIGLVVNRSEGFYPSWDALTGPVEHVDIPRVRSDSHLDDALHRKAAPDGSAHVTWQPALSTGRGLASAPSITVPPAYLRQQSSTFPVVLAVVDQDVDWAGGSEDEVFGSASEAVGPAVLVVLRTTPKTAPAVLAAGLPNELRGALRVSEHGWALVASPAASELAFDGVRDAPARYSALILVGTSDAATSPDRVSALGGRPGAEWETAFTQAVNQLPAPLDGRTPPGQGE